MQFIQQWKDILRIPCKYGAFSTSWVFTVCSRGQKSGNWRLDMILGLRDWFTDYYFFDESIGLLDITSLGNSMFVLHDQVLVSTSIMLRTWNHSWHFPGLSGIKFEFHWGGNVWAHSMLIEKIIQLKRLNIHRFTSDLTKVLNRGMENNLH